MEAKNASYHVSNSGSIQTQCSPMPQPALGFQRIIYGNGTSVGTVIVLHCPDKHNLIGDSVKCVLVDNSTHWEGETYCTPLSYNELHGFRLALLVSIVSSGIIFFMSVAFLTCCLVDCIEKSKRKDMERDCEVPPQWDEQHQRQDMHRAQHSNKSRNNNNNNLIEKELTQPNHPDQRQSDYSCRCQQYFNYDAVASPCVNGASAFPALPGYEYDQPLLSHTPHSSDAYSQNHGSALPSDRTQIGSMRSNPVWQFHNGAKQQGNQHNQHQSRSKNPKEFSFRVISV